MLYNPKECREGKKVCPFFLLENSRPLSPWEPLDSLSTCLGTDSLTTNQCFPRIDLLSFSLAFCFSSTSSDLLLLISFPSLFVENGVLMAFSILNLSHNHRRPPKVSNLASDTVVFYYKFLVLVSFYSQIDIYFSFDIKLIYEYKSHTPKKTCYTPVSIWVP